MQRLITLFYALCGAALVGSMLWAVGMSLDTAKPKLASSTAAPSPASAIPTARSAAAASLPIPEVAQPSLDQLREACAREVRSTKQATIGSEPACQRFAAASAAQLPSGYSRSAAQSAAIMDRLTEETTPPPRVYTASHYSGGDSSECFALIDEKGNINERMRHGYHEPEGEYLRGRLREINRRLWELHCPRQ